METNVLELIVHPKKVMRRIKRQGQLRRLAQQRPSRLVVGAGGIVPDGWVGAEIDDLNLLSPEDWEQFFADATLDAILAEHVWEHLSVTDGQIAALTCYRFLASGGYLRVAVPDALHPDPKYIRWTMPGGDGPGADDHKVHYTYATFSDLFKAVGFEVRLLEYFDESRQFHGTEWDPLQGMIRRSCRFDTRNANGQLKYTSLILDAVKP
jgi:predicted SAM-dependent methyltransferase